MTNGNDRLDRIERILEEAAERQSDMAIGQENFEKLLAQNRKDLSARRQSHEEAYKRHDIEMKAIRNAQTITRERLRALLPLSELRNFGLEKLEGGEPN